MAMNFAKWNEVADPAGSETSQIRGYGGRYKLVFFVLTFDTTSVGGIAGTTYDPTNHKTTHLRLGPVNGKNIFDLWGATNVHQMYFSNGSSDLSLKGAAADSNTGEVKGVFVPGAGNEYIKVILVGNGSNGADTVAQDEAEIDTTAASLSALRFTGYAIVS